MPKGEFPDDKTPWHKTSRRTLAAFEHRGEQYHWWADYQELRAEGHGWKIAVYIAWAASPTDRQPKTIGELADTILGVTDRTVRKWRKADPTIDQTVELLKAAPFLRHRRDVIDALVEVATMPDPKAYSDRRMFLEITGDYKPRHVTEHDGKIGVGSLSADQLAQAEFELAEFEAEQGAGDG